MTDLKRGNARHSSRRLGSWIVPVQVAVSVVLLVSASLLGGTFLHLLLEHSGFQTAGVTMAQIDLKLAKPTKEQALQDVRRIVNDLNNAPGVEAATVLSIPPIDDYWVAGHYFSVGKNGAVHTDMRTWPEMVSPGYFKVMGTRILEGRGFKPSDGEHVCLLSVSAAAFFFPDQNALGKLVYLPGWRKSQTDGKLLDRDKIYRVVGIAENARFLSLTQASPRALYRLAAAGDGWKTGAFLAVRSSSTKVAVAAIRSVIHRVLPGAPEPKIFTFDQLVAKNLQRERMLTSLSACFAAIALLLTVIGLYGLLSRIVTLRTKEIGLRMALGAQPRNALALVIQQALRLVLIGAAIGLLAAFGIARLLRALLSGVQPDAPWILSAAAAALIIVALAASYLPARRAAKVDPMTALREE
jgi:predicted permease